MTFKNQLKIFLWKNNKIFWNEPLNFLVLCLEVIITIIIVCREGI